MTDKEKCTCPPEEPCMCDAIVKAGPKPKHTPTPLEGIYLPFDHRAALPARYPAYRIVDFHGMVVAEIPITAKGNPTGVCDLICRAVNSHEALLKAAKFAHDYLLSTDDDAEDKSEIMRDLAKAIAQAEGKS